ncbi:zinc ribbon domain-containing protein [Halorarius halobius]
MSAAWRTFLSLLDYKCEREGTHFVAVNPKATPKEWGWGSCDG